ncbi:ParB/RepB/Spo0J family partition protein [Candidatus Soleaferrea massiliensis]|uniref:ParB/RepB/Spo0J family partition protein n=1 Tax=Candidatus Soleaferrea massiliensis TaxID=1470354 RepID=UPI0009E5A33D|nr:ParB/RepB/Spo0J family partition protein [Candidatus Soleaferrea massiliensis]
MEINLSFCNEGSDRIVGIFSKEKVINKVLLIDSSLIIPNPSQPRKFFEEYELISLSESIKSNGILQPLTVRRLDNGRFELIAGERRLKASKLAGLTQVPCIVISADERQSAILALIENLQRQDLNMFEEAAAIQQLIDDWGVTQEEASKRLGKAQSTIANKLRLLKLSEAVQEMINKHGLTERHARVLLKLPDEMLQRKALQTIISNQYNVKQSEGYVEQLLEELSHQNKRKPHRQLIVKDVRLFLNTISKAVETMVQSGIQAVTTTQEIDGYIEYVVRIPKSSQYKR